MITWSQEYTGNRLERSQHLQVTNFYWESFIQVFMCPSYNFWSPQFGPRFLCDCEISNSFEIPWAQIRCFNLKRKRNQVTQSISETKYNSTTYINSTISGDFGSIRNLLIATPTDCVLSWDIGTCKKNSLKISKCLSSTNGTVCTIKWYNCLDFYDVKRSDMLLREKKFKWWGREICRNEIEFEVECMKKK